MEHTFEVARLRNTQTGLHYLSLLQAKNTERERSVYTSRWQEHWERPGKGRWTHRRIPIIEKLLMRRHAEINYNLIQFLTGHTGYRQYLYRFKLDTSPHCPNCDETHQDSEYVFVHCPRFMEQEPRSNYVSCQYQKICGAESQYAMTMRMRSIVWSNLSRVNIETTVPIEDGRRERMS